MLAANPISSKILGPSSLGDIGILKDVSKLGEPAAADRIFELYQIPKWNFDWQQRLIGLHSSGRWNNYIVTTGLARLGTC